LTDLRSYDENIVWVKTYVAPTQHLHVWLHSFTSISSKYQRCRRVNVHD